jgi:uncharacterized protein YbaA (DUF1428 family)
MSYVDGFVIPIPKKNIAAYRRMARLGNKVWLEHGALAYYECIGDDLSVPAQFAGFHKMAKLKKTETVVFAWIVYKSKAHRNKVNAKVMADPRMHKAPNPMPFDHTRMAFGGFKVIVKA